MMNYLLLIITMTSSLFSTNIAFMNVEEKCKHWNELYDKCYMKSKDASSIFEKELYEELMDNYDRNIFNDPNCDLTQITKQINLRK